MDRRANGGGDPFFAAGSHRGLDLEGNPRKGLRVDLRVIAALVLAVVGVGCAGTLACPPDRACGVAAWQEGDYSVDHRVAIAPLVEAVGPGATPEVLSVSPQAMYLRFDLAPLAEAAHIERAVLSLDPAPAWRPSGVPQRLIARGVTSSWTRDGILQGGIPAEEASPAGEVNLPAHARGPVRMDVTGMVQGWIAGAVPAEGVAIEATGTGAAFVGTGANALRERARLEVVYR